MRQILRAVTAVAGLALTASTFAVEPTDMDGAQTPNGKVAIGYMNEVFNGKGPQEAQKKYFAANILNHGNLAAQMQIKEAAAGPASSGPPPGGPPPGTVKRSIDVKKVIVQGDLVFVQGHTTRGSSNELQWELFRIKDGKIVEVWNIHSGIPDDQMGKQW